jgi:hypothetical protein
MADELRIEINKMRLDEEWLNQPQQFYTWSKRVADAQLKFDEAKSDLSLTEAELDKEIRDAPQNYGCVKTTDAVVAQTIKLQKPFIAAQKALNRARYELGIAAAAVAGLDQRKRALEKLVDLWTREYYSDPNPRPQSEGSEEFDREAVRRRGINRMQRKMESNGGSDV